MAKQRKPGRLLAFLRQFSTETPEPVVQTQLGTDVDNSIGSRERDAVVQRIAQATTGLTARSGDSYNRYIQPLAKQIAETRLDAKAIETLAPQVKTAKEIVIPSIMSPTDMRDGEITITSASPLLDSATNNKISQLLQAHFNGEQKLSTKLYGWIHECLYGAGAQPIMVLPVSEIDTIINDPSAIIGKTRIYGGTETLQEKLSATFQAQLDQIERTSLFGIADVSRRDPADKAKSDGLVASLKSGVEAAVETYLREDPTKEQAGPYNRSKVWTPTVTSEIRTFTAGVLENLSVADNPEILKVDKAKKSAKKAEITQRMANVYKTTSLITVNPETKSSIDHPVVMELPPESVVPVFTPGTPSDHIGYFVILDEFGNPLRALEGSDLADSSDTRPGMPAGLYKTFGFDDSASVKKANFSKEQTTLMANIYQTVVEAHLKARLQKNGLGNIYIGAPSSVYRNMFARYLAARKTRMLFIPRDLMTYMCFRYNEDGTGRSKLEDIKFILSLKITLLICRVLASMNASINRKKININFTDAMGDPIAFMQLVEKEYLDKQMTNFSYDPVDIQKSLASRSLTVSPKGIPGIENFEITSEANPATAVKPDEGLAEDLDNMMILALDVPATAYNSLGDNEYSRSIVTNNLFFARRIGAYQRPVCEAMARHVQLYITMSGPLKAQITALLKSGDDTSETEEPGTGIEKTPSLDVKLTSVIKHITTSLPSPNIAPNKTEFEELDAVLNSLNTAMEALYENDLGATDDNPIPMIRAMIKSSVVRAYLEKIGAARDVNLPDLSDPAFIENMFKVKLNIANLSAGLKAQMAVTKPADVSPAAPTDQSF